MQTIHLTDDETKVLKAMIGAAFNQNSGVRAAKAWLRDEEGETLENSWEDTLAILADKLTENADER